MKIDPKFILVNLVALVALSGIVMLVNNLQFTSWDFRNNLWGPTFLLVHGRSPYAIDMLFDNSRALWMPMVIGLFFPLGWLTQYQATTLWLLANIGFLAVIVWLSAEVRRPASDRLLISWLAVFLFPPVISHLILGQFTILTALLLLLAARWIQSPHVWLVGGLAAMSLTKPQLSMLGLCGLLIYCIRDVGVRRALTLAGAIAVWLVVLTIPLWLGYGSWPQDFVKSLQANPPWTQPSLFATLTDKWGAIGTLAWIIVAIGAFGVNVRFWLRQEPVQAMYWSLALTTIIAPYLWSWDFVLLLPLFVHTWFLVQRQLSRILLGLGYGICWVFVMHIRLTTENSDQRYWWVPPVLLSFVIAVNLAERRNSVIHATQL